MKDNKQITKFQYYNRLVYSLFIVLWVYILLYIVVFRHQASIYGGDVTDYSEKWYYTNGKIVDFDDFQLKEYTEIQKTVRPEDIKTQDLCFYTKNIYFTVLVNNTPVYDFHPNSSPLFGKAYGVYPHTISLPVTDGERAVRIKIDNVYPGKPGIIKSVSLADGNQFLIEFLLKTEFMFILCIIGFVFGFILLIIGMIGKFLGEKQFEIISLAAFSMITSLWIMSETGMLSVLTGVPLEVHFADYMALDLIPLTGLLYVVTATGFKKKFVITISMISTISVIVYSIASTLSDQKDYHELIWITHINMACIALMMFAILVYSIVSKKLNKRFVILLLTAVFISLFTGIIDIVRYNLFPSDFAETSYFKYSIFAFIALSGIYEFIDITEMSRRGQYAEIMEKLAYTDGLTNLQNRKAFNRDIDAAAEGTEACTFIMIDMNYLKKANDELGHQIGDLFIKKIADVIEEVFTNGEKNYRIGGDEFFVLANYKISDPKFKETIDLLYKTLDEFNEKNKYAIPLSVAYGATEFNPKEDNVEKKIQESDEKMYEMKLEMKAART